MPLFGLDPECGGAGGHGARLEDARKVLEPVIRAHRIPIEPKAANVKAWKAKREIFFPLVQEMEWPRNEDGDRIEKDDTSETEIKRMDARIVAWLGVIKTCLELQILPTDKNADRLRKARVWTTLSGNGKVNPNWIDPKAPKPEPEASKPEPEASKPEPEASKPEPEASKPEPEAKTASNPPSKGTAPQKGGETIHPLTSNISGGSETPISPREHCGILLDQLFRNEVFRGEFAPILAMCLDSNVATVTRCLVEARDAMLNGKGGKA